MQSLSAGTHRWHARTSHSVEGEGAYLMFGGAALAAAEMSCFMLNDGASFSLVRSCTCTITA